MRVLVVEDEEKVASFIRKGLEEEHHAVDVALDGEEGLAMAQFNPYDVVVLDLMLPKLDGTGCFSGCAARASRRRCSSSRPATA